MNEIWDSDIFMERVSQKVCDLATKYDADTLLVAQILDEWLAFLHQFHNPLYSTVAFRVNKLMEVYRN